MIIDVIHKYQSLPFSYDGADCCQFVADCVEAVTGVNPAEDFHYKNETEANELIGCYGSLRELIDSTFIRVLRPSDGCITVCENAGRQVAGVVYRGRIIVRTETGITDFALGRGLGFWRA